MSRLTHILNCKAGNYYMNPVDQNCRQRSSKNIVDLLDDIQFISVILASFSSRGQFLEGRISKIKVRNDPVNKNTFRSFFLQFQSKCLNLISPYTFDVLLVVRI